MRRRLQPLLNLRKSAGNNDKPVGVAGGSGNRFEPSRKRATCAARGSPLLLRRNRRTADCAILSTGCRVRKRWRDLPGLPACTPCSEGGYGHGSGSYPPSSARHSRDMASRPRPVELPSGTAHHQLGQDLDQIGNQEVLPCPAAGAVVRLQILGPHRPISVMHQRVLK
jgi:hypothetical protein